MSDLMATDEPTVAPWLSNDQAQRPPDEFIPSKSAQSARPLDPVITTYVILYHLPFISSFRNSILGYDVSTFGIAQFVHSLQKFFWRLEAGKWIANPSNASRLLRLSDRQSSKLYHDEQN
jgi:hypothetical protein